jgi:uncharacterized metal-binding protein YceD (DUF177 family)
MNNLGNGWSVPVTVEEIAEAGQHLSIEASADLRAAIAALAGLRELPRLSADFDLTRQGAGVHVVGTVRATVGQTCVVSLEPMQSEVEEVIDVTFAPPPAGSEAGAEDATGKRGRPRAKSSSKPADEPAVTYSVKPGEEPPEPLIGGIVDLGALATEFLLLGIDPYPRKAGAAFAPPKAEDAESHPFAALAALKKPLESDRS